MSSTVLSAPMAATATAAAPSARRPRGRAIGMSLYVLFLFVPIYWLVNISFKTNGDILSGLSL